MKKIFILLILSLLVACSTSKYSLPDQYPFTQISSSDGIELYLYRGTIGNTCYIGIMSGKDEPNITYLSGMLVYDFLNDLTSIEKKLLENKLDEIIKDYSVNILDNKIIFTDVIKEKISKIPSSILNEKVKKLGEFTCSYAAILEELMKGKNSEDE